MSDRGRKNLRGAVGAAVIDDQNIRLELPNLVQNLADVFKLVVNRNGYNRRKRQLLQIKSLY